MGLEDASGSPEDFGAVSLDFLFELDPWLFGGLDADAAPAAGQDALALLLSPSALAPTASAPHFASLPTASDLDAQLVMLEPAPVALPPPVSTLKDEQPARKKAKPNKSTSQRQKEELTFLRSKVEKLEGHLAELKSGGKRGDGERTGIKAETPPLTIESLDDAADRNAVELSLGDEDEDGKGEGSLWERIAKRQQEEKAKAEVENLKLREVVEGQIKLVRSFERLLRKRQIWEQLQEDQWRKGEAQAKRDDEIFDELVLSIDARRPLLERIFEVNGLHNASPEGGDANLKYAPTNGMYIEFKDTKFLPFDHKMIDSVMWRSISEGKLKLEDCTVVTTKAVGDIVMSKCVVNKPGCSPKPVTVWSTVKRFGEGDHLKFVYETTVMISSTPGTALPPVKLVQQGWGRLAPVMLRNGSTGTVMQSYSTSVPTVLEAEPRSEQQRQQEHREIDILTELIFTSYQQNRQMLHQTIENLVLDEALARSAAGSDRA